MSHSARSGKLPSVTILSPTFKPSDTNYRPPVSVPKRTNFKIKVKNPLRGAFGTGDFYHIEVRPKKENKTFRTRDVGEKTGIERSGGQSADGSWETVKWLDGKDLAHVEDGRLVADCREAKELFD